MKTWFSEGKQHTLERGSTRPRRQHYHSQHVDGIAGEKERLATRAAGLALKPAVALERPDQVALGNTRVKGMEAIAQQPGENHHRLLERTVCGEGVHGESDNFVLVTTGRDAETLNRQKVAGGTSARVGAVKERVRFGGRLGHEMHEIGFDEL